MKNPQSRIALLSVLIIAALASVPCSTSADHEKSGGHQRKAQDQAVQGFLIPTFDLAGKLSKIFTISRCEYISGLTCHIHYNGKLPLPSEVFFTEFDAHGKKVGARVRLIYPELKPGETGVATFRVRSGAPAKLVLKGEWNGSWRNPY